MKTAMHTVIDYLQEMLDDDFDSRTKYIQEFCVKVLETEKEQIINAAHHGVDFENSPYKNAEDYYKETYKN